MTKRLFTWLSIAALFATSALAQDEVSPYFSADKLVDATKYLPAPPDTTSVHYALDMHSYYAAKALRDTERGAQAIADANGIYTDMCLNFSDAFGMIISPEHTPAIYKLVANSLKTVSNATSQCKDYYNRMRPFQRFHEQKMITGEALTANSYPSTHSAKGWMLALLLSEINPHAQKALTLRGYEYGQSRVIVGAHWQSDVDAGRLVGSVTYSRMHSNERFLLELEEAKKEFSHLRKMHDSVELIDADKIAIGDRHEKEQWYTIDGKQADDDTKGIVVGNGRKVLR